MVGVNQPPHIHSRVELDPTFWVKGAFGWSADARKEHNGEGGELGRVSSCPWSSPPTKLLLAQPAEAIPCPPLQDVSLPPPHFACQLALEGSARLPSQDGIKPRTALLTHSDPDIHDKPCRAPHLKAQMGGAQYRVPLRRRLADCGGGGCLPQDMEEETLTVIMVAASLGRGPGSLPFICTAPPSPFHPATGAVRPLR